MIPVRHYRIELDVEGFNTTNSGLIIVREGTDADMLPQHGVIEQTPLNAKFKKGDIAFVNHFILKGLYEEEGKYYLNVFENDIVAVRRGDKWIDGTMIAAEKIKREQREVSSIIITPDKAKKSEYYTQRYKTKEGIVWTYKNSNYAPPYLEDVTFLRPRYLVYNEDTDKCLNDFVVLKPHYESKDFKKSESGIYTPQKDQVQRGKATVVKNNKFNLKGDVLFLKSTHNELEHTDGLSTVRFQYILGCYEKN